ncbi:MAG: PD-(D/E)XK nuclease family protein [Clostridia bacterium]|nr:PD-(D/E)XK nuclease family protein [Clostridia bacterium]
MLEFLLGTAESEKLQEIYRRALSDAKSGKSAFILVPEQYSMYAEEELLSTLGFSAQNKIQILTFSRLSNMIFSKLGPLRTKYADKAGKYLLACRSMQLCRKQLKCLSGNVTQSGFARLMTSAISEFKRYGVSPQALENAAQEFENSVLGAKLFDLSQIYAKFNALLEETQSNSEDNLPLATKKIPEADFLQGTLYISYFRSFTPVEYEAIEMLMKKMDICVSLCCDNPGNPSAAFFSQATSYQKLCRIASQLGIKANAPVFLSDQQFNTSTPEIFHLKENYFSTSPKSLKGAPTAVHIVRPQNYYTEVQQAARLITRLCRTKGYRFNDILILTGAIDRYKFILPSIFSEFGISFFMDQKLRLTESPFMQMILSLLEILAFGFSYSRVMTILRSGFWNISKTEADIFENYILAADITHKQWALSAEWTYNPRKAIFDLEEINQIKKKALAPIHALISAFSGRKTASEICGTLCDHINSLGLADIVSGKAQEFRNQNQPHLAEYLEGVWNSFASVTAQISDCMGDTKTTFTEFYELFSSCCSELTVGIVPPTQDKVMISEINHFRSTGAKAVIVLGVIDGIFPEAQTHEGLISDAERLKLREKGITLAPDAYTKQKEDQFLIYSVFDAAKEELYLMSPISDSEGKSLGGSEITKRIKTRIFPDIQFEPEDDGLDLIEGQESTFSELCARLFECNFDPSALPPIWKSVLSVFEKIPKYSHKLVDFKQMSECAKHPAEISAKLADKLYGKPLSLSVSKLEKYNSCAFSFFMKYGLLAEERLLGGLKSTDTGTILHDILCRYFKEKSKNNADYSAISREECFEEISSIVSDITQSAENPLFATSNYYGYMLMRLKSIAASTAWKLVGFYSNSDFRPSGFEVSFGEHGTLPPYEIKTQTGKVSLKGFIDRIDSAQVEGNTYITITDYKSSEKRLEPAMIDAGITIQPFIYANAVANASPGQTPAAMMYLQMNDPILSFDSCPSEKELESGMNDNIKAHGLFLDQPDVILALDRNADDKSAIHYIDPSPKSRLVKELFERRMSDAEECAARTAEKIADGIIEANPPQISGFYPCEYCPYDSICHKKGM